MGQETVIFREEHLQKLALFCQALGEAFSRSGLSADQAREVWNAAATAGCVRCGIAITGDELFALSQPAGDNANPKVRRLRLGDCARSGCESYFYRLTFRAHPPLGWLGLLAKADAIQGELERPGITILSVRDLAKGLLNYDLTRRAAIILTVLCLILFIRHWYMGGAIPLVREPEDFRVTPTPEDPNPAEPGRPTATRPP